MGRTYRHADPGEQELMGPCYSAELEDTIGYDALLESRGQAFTSDEARVLGYYWSS
jgi:hypothetical protein